MLFLMLLRQPRATLTDTLLPFTCVFRSAIDGEGAEWIVAYTISAYHAVLRLHSEGQVVDEVYADAEFLGDTVGGVDVVDLVPLHGVQAASAVLAWGFQFHGSRSSICRIEIGRASCRERVCQYV